MPETGASDPVWPPAEGGAARGANRIPFRWTSFQSTSPERAWSTDPPPLPRVLRGLWTELAPKAGAWWDSAAKTVRCGACGDAPVPLAREAPPKHPPSLAGGSAQREFERRRDRREATVRARHPHVGGLILAVTDEPQSTTNWAIGAEGERILGAGLDGLSGVVMLHDRRRPGTSANIDHLAVTATGVWVIDAKRYRGEVAKKDVGGWLSTDIRLFVGRRDCSKLVTGMAKQVAAVRTALGADWADVPIRPMLCFVEAEWKWFAKPFDISGVLVTWPKAARQVLVRPGQYLPDTLDLIAAKLEERLPAAS